MPTPRSLDATDRALLTLLQEDARQTNKDLAARVGLAPSSCLERVRRLQGDGFFSGFHAEVEPSAVAVDEPLHTPNHVRGNQNLVHHLRVLTRTRCKQTVMLSLA